MKHLASKIVLSVLAVGAMGTSVAVAAMQDTPKASADEAPAAAVEFDPVARAAELGLPASAVYNPELDEYYDSNCLEWNAETHSYVNVQRTPATRAASEPQPEKIPFTGTVPEEIVAAKAAYDAGYLAYCDTVMEKDPYYMFRSFIPYEEVEGYHEMFRAYAANFDVCFALATSDDDDYSHWARNAVMGVFDVGGFGPKDGNLAANYIDYFKEMYTNAVQATYAAEELNAETVAALQEKHGYLIAPALQAVGKLDLMQIDADALVTDPALLVQYAGYLAEL